MQCHNSDVPFPSWSFSTLASMAKTGPAVPSTSKLVLTLQKACSDLECKLDIKKHWDLTSDEWNYWDDHLAQCNYYHAIDTLEGLVVSRLFELTKMNQSETGKCLQMVHHPCLDCWSCCRLQIAQQNQQCSLCSLSNHSHSNQIVQWSSPQTSCSPTHPWCENSAELCVSGRVWPASIMHHNSEHSTFQSAHKLLH